MAIPQILKLLTMFLNVRFVRLYYISNRFKQLK